MEVVDFLMGKKKVSCKWVFTLKFKANGTLERPKQDQQQRGTLKLMELITIEPLHDEHYLESIILNHYSRLAIVTTKYQECISTW